MSSKKPLVLLTNDDGFYSEGISVLYQELKDWAQLYIVAPDREKSATSLALTLHHPLRVKPIQANVYAVDGTPVDCVFLAVQKLLPRYPDLLISGLNHGPNLGQQDISYSGTVAAAIQGAFLNIPSIAVSVFPDKDGSFSFDFSAKIVLSLSQKILEYPLPQGISLNINIPSPPLKGIKITRLGQKRYTPQVIEKKDPRGRLYYWIGTGNPKPIGGKDSDVRIAKGGFITVTPLHKDLTDTASFRSKVLQKILASIQEKMF
jgi:5'-nucleotidase